MNFVRCCILGCKNKDILSVCKTCKFYFCLDHDNLINSHELVKNSSIYNNYYCCDFDCEKHFYILCHTCEELVINTMTINNAGVVRCKFPCYKFKK